MLIVALLLASCKTISKEVEVPIKTEIKVVEKVIAVPSPQDSARIFALFECDSLNQVIMSQINEEKTDNLSTKTTFNNGQLSFKVKTIRDTIYVHQTDSFIYKEKPVRIEVPVEVNKLKWWQQILIWVGVFWTLLYIAKVLFRRILNK